jgi:hypothetical protein
MHCMWPIEACSDIILYMQMPIWNGDCAICTLANFLGLARGAVGVVVSSKSGPVPPLVRSQEVIMSVQSAWSVLELHHQCCSMVNG